MESSFLQECKVKGGLRPRDGHTVRMKNQPYKREKATLRSDRSYGYHFQSNNARYLTMVDTLPLGRYDVRHDIEYSTAGCGTALSTKTELLDTVVDTLEEECIDKHIVSRCKDQYSYDQIVYKLPAVAEVVSKSDLNQKKFLMLQGKRLYTGIIYLLRGSHTFDVHTYEPGLANDFQIYGKYHRMFEDGSSSPTRLMPTKTKELQQYNGNIRINQDKAMNYVIGWIGGHLTRVEKKGDGVFRGVIKDVIIDLGKDRIITHIGMMGRPLQLLPFPSGKVYELYKIPKDSPSIWYTTESNKHYVSYYKVYVRSQHSKNWICLGEYQGNNNRLTEIGHRLTEQVFVRYVKIIPLKFTGSPSMQIGLYGPTTERTTQRPETAQTKTVSKKALRNMSKALSSGEDDKMVKYTLTLPSDKNYCLDVLKYSPRCWDRKFSESPTKEAKEQLEELNE